MTKSKVTTTHKSVKETREHRQRNSYSVDFYLHMTNHCVIGDHTLLLTFQVYNQENYCDDVFVVSTVLIFRLIIVMGPDVCNRRGVPPVCDSDACVVS